MPKPDHRVSIRRATPEDAPGIVRVLGVVVDERIYSAIDRVWSAEEERQFASSLSPREAVHVAVDMTGAIVGLQILDRWSSLLPSMSHVGQVGTFLLPEWRQRGLGRRLWEATLPFARSAGYRKLVIQVRASNVMALRFYGRLGFVECGRLRGQVVIDGAEDDEGILDIPVYRRAHPCAHQLPSAESETVRLHCEVDQPVDLVNDGWEKLHRLDLPILKILVDSEPLSKHCFYL